MSRHICDCGAVYSNLDAVLGCQNANHGMGAPSKGREQRALFAAMIMQGMCAAEDGDSPWHDDKLAKRAVMRADALLAELKKPK